MKNSRSLLLIPALALLALGSCSKPEKNTLRLLVDNIDRSCPVDLGSTGVMESARYDEKANRVVLTYVVNEDEVEIAGLSKVTAEQKTFLSSFLRSDSASTFLNSLVDADASLAYTFRGATSRDSIVISLDASELKEISTMAEDEDNARAQLESIVAITNRQCPSTIDDGLTLTSVAIEGEYITFYYSYDTSIITIPRDVIPELTEATKTALREELSDPSGRTQLALMKECGIGARYIYNPTTEEETPVIVIISPDEIAKF